MGRGAEASELLLTSICSGVASSMACSWGQRSTPATRGLRAQPSPAENLTGLRNERGGGVTESGAEAETGDEPERRPLPERRPRATHDPPGGAHLGFKGELLLDVL